MEDRDLGTAHGKIHIESEIDAAATIAKLAAIGAALKGMDQNLGKTTSLLEKFETVSSKIAESAKGVASGIGNLSKEIAAMGAEIGKTAGSIGGLDLSLQGIQESAIGAGKALWPLVSQVNQLRSMSGRVGFARGLMRDLSGINKEISTFPKWVQGIVKISGTLATVGTAAAFVSPHLRLLAGTMGHLFPEINKLGQAMRVLGFNLGTAVPEIDKIGRGIRSLGSHVRTTYPQIVRMFSSLSAGIAGVALVRSGLKGLAEQAAKLAPALKMVGLAYAGLAAFGPVSSIISGAIDVVKQLGGALWILPGAVASIIPLALTAKVAFGGFGDALKAAMDPAANLEDKIKDLSPSAQEAARGIRNVSQPLKDLKKEVQESVFSHFSKQIEPLVTRWLPLLKSSMTGIGSGIGNAISNLVQFASESRSIRDFSIIMQNSERLTNNLSHAIAPLAGGFRNLAVVGSSAFADMTSNLGGLAQLFDIWTDKVRNNGDMDHWIRSGIQGFKDLGSSIKDFGSGLGSVFHFFGGGQQNVLARMAESAERFKKAVESPASGSDIGAIMDHLRTSGSQALTVLESVAKSLSSAFVDLIPTIEEISQSFGSHFSENIKIFTESLSILGQGLHSLGIDTLIGRVVAMSVAFKLMKPVIMSVFNALKLVFGIGLATKFSSGILSAATALDGFAAKGGKVGAMATGMQNKMLAFASAISGPVVAAFVVLTAAITAYFSYANKMNDYNSQLEENNQKLADSFKSVGDALEETGGKLSPKVFDAMSASISTMQEKLDKQSSTRGGFWDRVGGAIGDAFAGPGQDKSNKSQIDEMNATNDAAKRAKETFAELGLSQNDLAKVTAGTNGEYQALLESLRGTKYGGGEAIAQVQGLRDNFLMLQQTTQATEASSPGIFKLRDAVSTLADSSSSAADKLNAMKTAMEAMGILQVSKAQAMNEYRQSIDDFKNSLGDGIPEVDKLSGALNAQTGIVDQSNVAYGALVDRLLPLADKLQGVGASGGDVNKAWSEMIPVLDQLKGQLNLVDDATGTADQKWQLLLRSIGLTPETVNTLVKIEGMTEAEQDLFTVQGYLDKLKVGAVGQVKIESQEAVDQIRSLGVWVERIGNTDQYKIKFHTEIEKDKFDAKIKELEQKYGIKIDTEVDPKLDPAKKAQIDKDLSAPVEKEVRIKAIKDDLEQNYGATPWTAEDDRQAEDWYKTHPEDRPGYQAPKNGMRTDPSSLVTPPEQKKSPAPNTPAPAQPAAAQKPGDQVPDKVTKQFELAGTDAAIGAVNAVRAALDAMGSPIVKQFQLAGTDAAIGAVNAVRTALDAMGPGAIKNFQLSGTDAAIGATNAINIALANIPDRTVKNIELSGTDAAIGATNSVVIAVQNMGAKIAAVVPQIAGSFGIMTGAATGFKILLDNIVATLNSLSAIAFNSGAALGQGFADGINSKIGAVQEAALALADAADAPLPHSPAKIGPFSGRGWTPFRGRKLAIGFAEGIHDGSSNVQLASMQMAMTVSAALDQIRAVFNVPKTSFDANRDPGAGGKKYYRDPEITDSDLKTARRERDRSSSQDSVDKNEDPDLKSVQRTIKSQELQIQKAEKDAIAARTAANKNPQNENLKERAQTAEDDLDRYKSNLQSSRDRLKELQDDNATRDPNDKDAKPVEGYRTSGSSTSAASAKIDSFVKSMDNAQYGMGAFNQSLIDCSGFVSAVVNVATGRPAFSERMNTTSERAFLKARGFREGKGGAGDLSVGWWDRGGGANGHTALTTPSGLNAESTTGGVRFGKDSAGARSNNGQFENFMYLPIGPGGGGGSRVDRSKLGMQSGKAKNISVKTGERTIPLKRNPDGTYGSTDPAWNHLIQRESGGRNIQQQINDANSGGNEAEGYFQITPETWKANGGSKYAKTPMGATAEQQAEIAAKIFDKSGGSPWGAGLSGRESESALRAGITRSQRNDPSLKLGDGSEEDKQDSPEVIDELRKGNSKLDKAINIAQSSNSSDAEVIRALQDMDDSMVGMSTNERESVDKIRSEIMQDRGIKEYDPYADAPKTPQDWFDTLFQGIAQNVLSLYNTIEQGANAAMETAHLLVRGVSNTKDVGSLIDGVQSVVNTVTQVVSTVGGLIDVVAKIAAAAGSSIPGVGQVTGAISAATGFVGNIQSVIDMVQEVAKIGGRYIGKGLSGLLGALGGTGELQGQVKMLLDMNDKTLKTWSDRNAADKAVIGLPGSKGKADPNQTGQFRDLNIYQGPGQDPADMMNNAMFAVAAHSQGVYGS